MVRLTIKKQRVFIYPKGSVIWILLLPNVKEIIHEDKLINEDNLRR